MNSLRFDLIIKSNTQAKSILSKYARDEKVIEKPKTAQDMHVEESGLIPIPALQYTSLNPNRQNSDLSLNSEPSTIGYEELPRAKYGQLDEDSVSSWDDDTVTTNSSAYDVNKIIRTLYNV